MEDIQIHILPLPYFLASKMDAFFDRGIKDLYGSHDLEDIVYLFNYSTGIVEQVLGAADEVKNYIVKGVKQVLDNNQIINALPGHLYFDGVDERMEMILNKMRAIILEI